MAGGVGGNAVTLARSDDTVRTRRVTDVIDACVIFEVVCALRDVIDLRPFEDLTLSSEEEGEGCDENEACRQQQERLPLLLGTLQQQQTWIMIKTQNVGKVNTWRALWNKLRVSFDLHNNALLSSTRSNLREVCDRRTDAHQEASKLRRDVEEGEERG